MGSTHGFFEMLIPVYCSQPQDSALSLSLSAVASEMLSLWRHHRGTFQSPRDSYVRAVGRLRIATQNPTERGKSATILAVLLLQFYENIAAVRNLRSAKGTHQYGAAALLPFADSNESDGTMRAYIRRYMLYIEISSALHQKRPLQPITYSWLKSKDLTAASKNPSSELDAIGASMAELQALYVQITPQGRPIHFAQQALDKCRTVAQQIDKRLLAWERNVPDHWRPLRLAAGREVDLSIPTYGSVCEIYPSCQIATIWNLWRSHRLLLAKITLVSLHAKSSKTEFGVEEDEALNKMEDYVECKHILQTMIESICHCVPYYLGNRTKVSSIADFTDPEIMLPSDYLLSRGDGRHNTVGLHEPAAVRDEHRRHVIAQGPWHIISPLSQLLIFFSEDNGELITNLLRPGQREWIREQFLRAATLLSLQPEEFCDRLVQDSVDFKAQHVAKAVKAGSVFTGGPP